VILATVLSVLSLTSGVHGVVMRGPIMPVCMEGVPCSAPAAHARVSFFRGGRGYRTTTDAGGRYRIALVPGRYTVHVTGDHFGVRPTSVVVPRGRFARQNLYVETGIR
jgi:Carboxypeptidase regulatory-like domain